MCRGSSMWIAPQRSVLLLTCSTLKCVHMSVEDPGQKEGWVFHPATLGPWGMSALQNTGKQKMSPHAALHCCTRRWSSLSAALWGSDMPSHHQQVPLQGWSAWLLALLQLFQQVDMSQPPPTPKKTQLLLPVSGGQQSAYEVLHLPEMQRHKSNALSVRNYQETFPDKRHLQVSPK